MSKPHNYNLAEWASYSLEEAQDSILIFPPKLWGDVVNYIAKTNCLYHHKETLYVNLVLWIK